MGLANPLRPAHEHATHRVYDIKSGLYCAYVAQCLPCEPIEKSEVYCIDTGHRRELLCPRENDMKSVYTRYQACLPQKQFRSLFKVVYFQITLVAIFLVASFALRKMKGKMI
uniref:AlNc14C2G254 protein n=1 Tax=Albugo laibachii Nc14 TaxID=890382 RepID=F0VZB3_9STRA|nr:AlNc14C2G254 [Albugo laibachii Nc14]|eukprot:CCA14143.1 AlNc14C2G254 [Albugo laibachii Nc14]